MSASLPEHPDLGQLRRQAKELRDAAREGDAAAGERIGRQLTGRPAGEVTLAAAQLVIAREYGFASWPKLKAAVEAGGGGLSERAEAFVTACVTGRVARAARLFEDDPGVGRASVAAATVTGDAAWVGERLTADPGLATTIDTARGWPLLLYVCYSRWHWVHPDRAGRLAEVARLLLAAGANPNTNNGGRPNQGGYRSALHGAVTANNPAIVALLLEQGANPDVESLQYAAEHSEHRCLGLLLSHGAGIARSWALDGAASAGDAEAVKLLLDAAGRAHPADQVARLASRALADSAASAPAEVVEALLTGGADPNGDVEPDDWSPLRVAVRAGQDESAAALLRRGARDDTTVADRLLGAMSRADRPATERILADQPGLPGRLSDDDRTAIVEAAGRAGPDAVELMLDVGFSVSARNGFGETPLHTAAYVGDARTARLLLARAAAVDALDERFDSTPLAFATVGSGERGDAGSDYLGTVTVLLEAGASRDGVWISGKPPSEAVAGLLRRHGIHEETEPEAQHAAPGPAAQAAGDGGREGAGTAAARETGTGVAEDAGSMMVREIAGQLAEAFRSLDLELFGSLLHPEVRWTGICQNRAQVLQWYEGILADGTRPSLQGVETRASAVIVCLALTRPAVAMAPAPPAIVYQVFRIADAAIVEILGYQDRKSALAATG